MELIIDSELQEFFPKLSENELTLLEENIKLGTIEPRLLVWKGKNIIIDGHNTYQICERLNHEYTIKEIEIETKEQAFLLMIQVQFGRRNLTQRQESYYRGLVTEKLVKNKNEKNLDNSAPTLEEFADQRKVTTRTLYNDRDYSQAVNNISETLDVHPNEVIDSDLGKIETIELNKEVPALTLTQLQKKLKSRSKPDKAAKQPKPTPAIQENDLVQIIYTKNCEELVGYKTSYAIARKVRDYSLDLSIWDVYIECVPIDNVRVIKSTINRVVAITPKLFTEIMNSFSSLEEAVKNINFPSISRDNINEGDKVKITCGLKENWIGTVQSVFNGTYFEIKLDNSEETETFCLDDLTLQK